jgi:glycosyltransferase involved in cell wall biosynthesis
LQEHGIKTYSLNISEKYRFKEALRKLIPIVNKEKPVIIHSTLFRADMVARRLKSKFPDIILVGSFVSNSYSNLRYSQLPTVKKLKLYSTQLRDRFTSKKVDYFIANSKTIKKSNAAVLDVPEEKITVIYRGRKVEDLKEFSGKFLPSGFFPDLQGKNCWINVGRLQQSKGQLDLIKAFKIFHSKNPQNILLIAGAGSLKQDIVKEIEKQELGSVVYLLGYLEDVKSLLAVGDYFVFPSYFEGLPGGVIEAVLSKIPCIVSDIPEIRECFPENGALFFSPGRPQEIAEKMIEATKITDWKERTNRSFLYAKKILIFSK